MYFHHYVNKNGRRKPLYIDPGKGVGPSPGYLTPLSTCSIISSPPITFEGLILKGSSQSNRSLLAQLEQKMVPAAISDWPHNLVLGKTI